MPDCHPYNQRDLEMFLYGIHYSGCQNPEEAHATLLKMTEGRQCFTLDEVKEHFRKIEKKEFKVKEDGVVTFFTLPVLFMFYPGIKKRIMDFCDFSDQLTLRKVSRSLREIMETTQTTIQKLELKSKNSTKITLRVDDHHEVAYLKVLKGVLVNCGDRAEYLKGANIFDLAISDLKPILGNEKLKIEELEINIDLHREVESKEKLEMVMKSLPAKPKVRHLTMGISDAKDLNLMLPYLEPGHLEVIKLEKHGELKFIHVKELESIEQWKCAKQFISNFVVLGKHIPSDFGHLDYVDVVMENKINRVGLKELGELKDILLLRPNLQKFEIIPTSWHSKSDPIFSTILPSFDPSKDKYIEEAYHFPYPNSSDMLTLRISKESIVFKGPMFTEDKISDGTKQELRRAMGYQITSAYKEMKKEEEEEEK